MPGTTIFTLSVEGAIRLPALAGVSTSLDTNGNYALPDALCAPAKGAGDESFPKAFLSRAVHLCWCSGKVGEDWTLNYSLCTNPPSGVR